MASSGLFVGTLTNILSVCLSGFGLHLLIASAMRTRPRDTSYFTILHATFPEAAPLVHGAISIKCFGSSVRWVLFGHHLERFNSNMMVHFSYLIVIKSVAPKLMTAFYESVYGSDAPIWIQTPRIWLVICMAILIPFCFGKNLSSVRYGSYAAVFASSTNLAS